MTTSRTGPKGGTLVGLKKYCSGILLASAAVFAVPAQAITFLGAVAGAPDPGASGDFTIGFEGALPLGIAFSPGSTYQILQGEIINHGKPPAGDLTHYLSVPGTGISGTATLDFTGYTGDAISDFSFYWGTIDKTNSLSILTTLGLLTLTGPDISATHSGTYSAGNNKRVFFGLAPGESLLFMQFTSLRPAFETDDFYFNTVPEPASWAMLVAGFGLVGSQIRRSKKARGTTRVTC